jgi:hypothetical protein
MCIEGVNQSMNSNIYLVVSLTHKTGFIAFTQYKLQLEIDQSETRIACGGHVC